MTDEKQVPVSVEPSLDDVLAQYISAEESGKPLDGQQLIAHHPQFAAELREFFANRDQMQRLAEPLRVPAGTIRAGDHPLKKIRYVGDYELLEEIAVGGMGVVYMARQVSLNRVVAVKMILKGTLARDDDVKRFLAEAEAAANLHHPAIVAIHEVGLHEGQHYFSMDFVEGHSLAQLPREQPLSARQAAEYIRDAAEAVHYAHEQGILHRDLKPSNILIDGQGRVRITDFGLAKKITGHSDLTLTGQILGTPSYMPPEQASGKRSLVAVASDIYSLGAVLYELLTGRPPFRGETPAETLRQVETFDPVSPRLLNPTVPRDLETICLKCLEKEPHKRYGTAQLLADDLGRYLRGETVVARPPSTVYRLGKFARRNRTGLSIATLVVLFVVVVGGVVGWMVRDRAAERAAFDQRMNSERAMRLAKTVEDIQLAAQEAQMLGDRSLSLVNDNPYQWEATLAAAIAAVKRAHALAELNKSALDPVLLERLNRLRERLEEDEQDRQFVARIDAIRGEAAQVDLQRSQFKGQQQSRKIESLFGSRGIQFDAKSPTEVVAWIQARPQPIQPHMLAAFDICLTGQASRTPEQRQWLADVLRAADDDAWRTEARRAMQASDMEALEKLVGVAQIAQHPATFLLLLAARLPLKPESIKLNFLKQIQAAHPNDFWANEDYALSLSGATPPRWTEATRFHTAAIAVRPDNPGVYLNLGQALEMAGDVEEAVVSYRRALEIAPAYAVAWNNLGNALRSQGKVEDAIVALRQAIRVDPQHALVRNNLGRALLAKGDRDGAIAEFREAVRIEPKNAAVRTSLGNALQLEHDVDGAVAEYREAIRLDPNHASAHNGLGITLRSKGDLEGAITEYREMIRLNPESVSGHINLGGALHEKRDFDGAIAECREAVRLDPKIAEAHNNLGNGLEGKGDLDAALAEYREAARLDPKLAEPHVNIGKMLQRKGDLDGAILECREAIRLAPAYALAHYNLGRLLLEKRSWDDAIGAFQEAIRIKSDFGDAYASLTLALESSGRPEEALAVFEQHTRARPNSTAAHNNLGFALLKRKKLDEAISAFREALRLDLSNQTAHYNLANALSSKGALEEAASEYRAIIRLKPGLAQAHADLGQTLRTLGKLKEAIASLREAMRLDPDLIVAAHNLGMALGESGQLDEATMYLTRAKELLEKRIMDHPELPDYRVDLARHHLHMGMRYRTQGQGNEAEKSFHAAISVLEPLASDFEASAYQRQELARALNELGMFYSGSQRYDQTRPLYEKATKLREKLATESPSQGAFAVELGGSYCNMGHLCRQDNQDFDTAIEWYHKAIGMIQPWLNTTAHGSTRKYLFNAYQGLAEASFAASEFLEAGRAYDQAATVSATPLPAFNRSRRALFWACAGEHEKATAEADVVAAMKPSAAVQIELAEVWAQAAATPDIEPETADCYAQQAITTIGDALARGYRNWDYLQESPHLESLKDRADFQQLLAGKRSPALPAP